MGSIKVIRSKTLMGFIFLLISISSLSEEMKLYFGDTHLHTAYSFDAFLNALSCNNLITLKLGPFEGLGVYTMDAI